MELTQEIGPNYTSVKSSSAEEIFASALDEIKTKEAEEAPVITKEQILETVNKLLPDRYKLVAQKLQAEGLTFSDLSKDVLLDRLLGIDGLLKYKGKTIGFDVTSGKGTLLYNKSQKQQGFSAAYQELGIDLCFVIKIRQQPEGDLATALLSKIDQLMEANSQAYGQVIKIS